MPRAAAELDACDPLAHFAAEFHKPPGQTYLDGNSLGLLCKPAEAALNQAVDDWKSRAIQGWTEGPEPWFAMSRRVAGLLAPILGAEADDVMVGQSTTVNLHQLLATFHRTGDRLLIDEWSFPSDRYAVESRLRQLRQNPEADLVVVPDHAGLIDEGELIRAMERRVRFAVLPAVAYRSGQLLDMANLTAQARERGVLIAWDCSHSAGVIPHRFRAERIDLAFGCTYKYLNGGPGSPGWLYVAPQLRNRSPGLAGWFGSDPSRQFEMSPDFWPADDAARFLIGTPHVLSLAPLLGALELINRAGIQAIREKSLKLTDFFLSYRQVLERVGFQIATPTEHFRRGGHLTLVHQHARQLSAQLRRNWAIIPDYRPPDLLRIAPAPLYTSFADCLFALDILGSFPAFTWWNAVSGTNELVT